MRAAASPIPEKHPAIFQCDYCHAKQVEDFKQRSHAKVRTVVWGFTVLLAGGLGALWWYSEQLVRDTQAALERQGGIAVVAVASEDGGRQPLNAWIGPAVHLAASKRGDIAR